MATNRDTRESKASFFVLKKIAKALRLQKGGDYLFDCPNCGIGNVKVVIKVTGERCCITARCVDSGPDCDFPTLSGPLKWNCEGKEADQDTSE